MPRKISKRYKEALEQVEPGKRYSVAEAADLVGKFPKAKFDESVELAFKMTIDPRKTDQMIRGTVRLPHGVARRSRSLFLPRKSVRWKPPRRPGRNTLALRNTLRK